MLKKISLAAIVALSTSVVTAPPASAFSCPDGSLPKDGLCPDTDVIPTPPAMLAVLGLVGRAHAIPQTFSPNTKPYCGETTSLLTQSQRALRGNFRFTFLRRSHGDRFSFKAAL